MEVAPAPLSETKQRLWANRYAPVILQTGVDKCSIEAGGI
jgi:hypothetical protein